MSNITNISRYIQKTQPKNYEALLSAIQVEYSKKYFELVSSDISAMAKKDKTLSFIISELKERAQNVTDTAELVQLATKLYNDMDGYSVLTEPLEDENVEGINVNSWRDIRVKFIDGRSVKIGGFVSVAQAKSIIQRLLQNSGVTIDDAIPTQEASINSNTRITAIQSPILDDDIGVACYIRKLRNRVFDAEEYIESQFANKKMLNLISTAVRRGVSILFVGKVNTGKTSILKYALDTLPDDMQIVTIESGAREMNLVKHNDDGEVVNNVVHMLAREHTKQEQNISQEKLVVKGLRFNPDVMSVAEMRDVEAHAAQEASLSGHTVVTTAHAGSVRLGHRRVASLCRKKYPTDFHEAMINACEAFPLVVFIHMGEDNRRRVMDMSECYVDDNEQIHYNPLWEFCVDDNITENDRTIVKGAHVQLNDPSEHLIKQMKLYGITKAEIQALKKEEYIE